MGPKRSYRSPPAAPAPLTVVKPDGWRPSEAALEALAELLLAAAGGLAAAPPGERAAAAKPDSDR
jgi:hypothetical protein